MAIFNPSLATIDFLPNTSKSPPALILLPLYSAPPPRSSAMELRVGYGGVP